MFVTVRIEMTTVRGARATAMAVVLALLSFLLLNAHCATDAHHTTSAEHTHAAKASHLVPGGEHVPTGHCHHNRSTPDYDALVRKIIRKDDTASHPRSSTSEVLHGPAATLSAALDEPVIGLRPASTGPPTPGRPLLIALCVARN